MRRASRWQPGMDADAGTGTGPGPEADRTRGDFPAPHGAWTPPVSRTSRVPQEPGLPATVKSGYRAPAGEGTRLPQCNERASGSRQRVRTLL